MYFAMLLFWLTGLVAALVSMMTSPSPPWRLVRTTFSTRFSESSRHDETPVQELGEEGTPATELKLQDMVLEEDGEH